MTHTEQAQHHNRWSPSRSPIGATLIAMLVMWGLPCIDAHGQSPDAADGGDAIIVGVYTPHVFFADSLARNRYAESLANALGAATGLAVRGRGYAGAAEFTGHVRSGAVHFAVVDAQYHIEHGELRSVAQATSGGKATRPMVAVVGGAVEARSIGALRGSRLATVDVGSGDLAFVSNFLLQGQIGPDYFKKGRAARDIQGALTLVKLGKAETAFTYRGHTAGMTVIFNSRPVPLPVFVQARGDLDPERAQAIRRAIIGLRAKSPVADGFGGYDAGVHAALKAALARPVAAPRSHAPVLAIIPGEDLPVPAFPQPSAHPAVQLPPVVNAFEVPPPPPDEF